MAAFNVKAVIHSHSAQAGEWDTLNDARNHVIDIARSVRGWIIQLRILPFDTVTGEVLELNPDTPLLPAPKPKVCPLGELTVEPVVRLPEVAIKQPYTYKEDNNG
jgi:hypothetical protein